MNNVERSGRPFYRRWWVWTLVIVILFIFIEITTSSAPQPAQPAPSNQVTITGYGALISDWNAHHVEDPKFQPNAAYNPNPALASGGDTRYDAQYYSVLWVGGRALGYNMRFPNGQSLASTTEQVIKEFPPEATIVWSKAVTNDPHSSCYQIEVESPTIGKLLGTDGLIFVELYTDTPPTANYNSYYDPANVNGGLLQTGEYKTAADAPVC